MRCWSSGDDAHRPVEARSTSSLPKMPIGSVRAWKNPNSGRDRASHQQRVPVRSPGRRQHDRLVDQRALPQRSTKKCFEPFPGVRRTVRPAIRPRITVRAVSTDRSAASASRSEGGPRRSPKNPVDERRSARSSPTACSIADSARPLANCSNDGSHERGGAGGAGLICHRADDADGHGANLSMTALSMSEMTV